MNKSSTALKQFAQGTTSFPVPIAGLGGPLVWSAGSVSTLTPIPKTGFLAKLRYTFKGTYTFSTGGATLYNPPFWRAIQNYTLQNSLNYPYRSLNRDDIWFWQQVMAQAGGLNRGPAVQSVGAAESYGDGVVGSNNYVAGTTTATSIQTFYWQFEDWIQHNEGVNFSRYLLSAMTTSNDLTINMTWAPVVGTAGVTALTIGDGTAVCSQFAMSCAVSAEYLTVPDPTKYAWPKRNLVQQMIGDPSYNTPAVGLNTINLTPIQGPEFLGLGIQVAGSGGVTALDSLVAGTTGITEIDIYVNGSIPLYQFTFADIIKRYELMYSKAPKYGYIYIDFSNDLGLVNAMSHTHRKVLSTAKYSQISVNVTLNSNFTAGTGAFINLFKRTQQSYSQNQ